MVTRRILSTALIAGALWVNPIAARASSIEINVLATAGPWDWAAAGLNSAYAYGPAAHDFTSPAAADLASLGLSAGDALFVLFKGGFTDSFGTGVPLVGNGGYVGSIFKDDVIGSSGQPLPSFYLPGEWGTTKNANDPTVVAAGSGVFLNALVGAWTDSTGAIISPFSLGTFTLYDDGSSSQLIGFSGLIPTGATRIQFGINDDIFIGSTNPPDNSGALQVCVASTDPEVQACVNGTSPAPVPEPASMLLVGSGVAGLVAYRRRRSH